MCLLLFILITQTMAATTRIFFDDKNQVFNKTICPRGVEKFQQDSMLTLVCSVYKNVDPYSVYITSNYNHFKNRDIAKSYFLYDCDYKNNHENRQYSLRFSSVLPQHIGGGFDSFPMGEKFYIFSNVSKNVFIEGYICKSDEKCDDMPFSCIKLYRTPPVSISSCDCLGQSAIIASCSFFLYWVFFWVFLQP